MKIEKIALICGLMLGFITLAQAQHPGDNPDDFPDNVDTADCTATPPAKSFDIKMKWKTPKYTGENDPHTSGRSTPLVADMDGDGKIEVITPWVPLSAGGSNNSLRPNTFVTRHLNVINGADGTHKYSLKTCDYSVHGQTIAIADANKDGKCEVFIVAVGPRKTPSKQLYDDKYVYCYDGSKANSGPNDYIWKSKEKVEYSFIPYVADINNDGIAEVVVGDHIFNALTGDLLVKGTMANTGMGFGGPHQTHGSWQQGKQMELGEQFYLFAVADIDGDKQLEICAGNTIYKANITNPNGTAGNTYTTLRTCTATLPWPDMYDGQTIVVDFDNDGDLDVCVVGRNKELTNFNGAVSHVGLYVWEGQTTDLIGYFICDPQVNSPSIPFAGDINGDGYPEVIFNGQSLGRSYGGGNDQMHVFRYKQGYTLNGVEKAKNIEAPFTFAQTTEFSESAGFTVFDFNQDGQSEIVYRGSYNLYILDGKNLAKLCDPMGIRSGTTAEYPIVADVDQDGHADIIVTEEYDPTIGAAGSTTVFESKTPAAWGPARKIWNQWPYNVVNINEDATVPRYTFDLSTPFGANGVKPFNAFLQQQTKLNVDGEMYAPAANAYVDTIKTKLTQHCDSITLDITFGNSGTEALYAPYGLTIYKDHYKGQIIYQKSYSTDLGLKAEESLHLKYEEGDMASLLPLNQFVISINDIGTGMAEDGDQQRECDTTNNLFACAYPGFITTEYDTVTHHMCVGEFYAIGESIYTEDGTYVDTLINRMGCDSIVTSYVYTHSISVDLGPDQSYCSNDYNPVTLDAGADPVVYEWQDGSADRTFTVFATGDYTVKVSDEYGCSDSDSVNVTIIPNPVVNITKDAEDFCSAGRVVLTANSSETDVTYQWNTGETSQSITIMTHGTYTVIVDNQGCTGTSNIQIPICPCEVWVPNAFSPNFDDINDVFLPKISSSLASYELMIFDRWGKMVFHTDDSNQAWDGTVKGAQSPTNVFTYLIYYTCASAPDKKLSKNGSITLIR